MRILLVDDNQAASTGIVWLLVDEGFEVDVLDCGRGVYGMVAASRPDALILDVGLPDVDGVTVADNVHRTWPDLPIILTTGHADYPGLKRALATPGTSLLRKPYAFEALVARLRSVTQSSAAHPGAEKNTRPARG